MCSRLTFTLSDSPYQVTGACLKGVLLKDRELETASSDSPEKAIAIGLGLPIAFLVSYTACMNIHSERVKDVHHSNATDRNHYFNAYVHCKIENHLIRV